MPRLAFSLALLSVGCLVLGCSSVRLERTTQDGKVIEDYRPGAYTFTQRSPTGRQRLVLTHGSTWLQRLVGHGFHEKEAEGFIDIISRLAEDIEKTLSQSGLSGDQIALLATTFVNLDDLYSTSTFGRLCSEQLAAELKARRFRVIELRRTKDLLVRTGAGELALSRESKEIQNSHEASALLVGTYTLTPRQVVLIARVLKTADNSLFAAGTAVFNRRDNLFLNSLLLSEQKTHHQAQAPRAPTVGVAARFAEPLAGGSRRRISSPRPRPRESR